MQLNLKKPIIFFDLETTGTNVTNDRIVEISLIKITPDGQELERTRRINPEMPIPAEATAVHHITDADVANEPTFKQIARSLADLFTGCDIAGFNSNRFDIPVLDQEFRRAGISFDFSRARFIDVQTIFHKKEQRTLVAAYKFYCGKDLDEAHSANADTRATYEVLKAQLDRYTDLPNDIDALSDFSSQNRNVDLMGRLIYDDQNREVINFGKYKGRLAEEVMRNDSGYYSWILQGDFPQNTKDCFTRIKLRAKK
ncbi:MAG: 3'-5' exonuclease [Bacteroidales bacterium]|nr:3'-5' exonuclease [Bacteroidales bacterium]